MDNKNLFGKSILFIGSKYFGVENKIIDEIIEIGGKVDFFPERPYSFKYRLLRNTFPRTFENYYKKYLAKLSFAFEGKSYDIVLIIRGQLINRQFIIELRKKLPSSKFVMYQWDSIKNNPYFLDKLDLFDNVFSFDPIDCDRYKKLRYLPLFYTDDYYSIRKQTTFRKKEVDVLVIGYIHGKRYEHYQIIRNWSLNEDIKFQTFLYLPILSYLKTVLEGKIYKHVTFRKLSFKRISEMIQKSTTVLDIPSENQAGLTIRTFETLASGTKLITTNKSILHHDFYDPEMILVLDLANPEIPKTFLEAKANFDFHQFEKYSIKNWLLKLLG